MKVLTICQPYAHLIAVGDKRVENRRWPTLHRGELAIHAGRSREWLDLDESGQVDETYGVAVADLAFGAIVAVVDVLDCVRLNAGALPNDALWTYPWLESHEHVEGPWCWVLGEVRRLPNPVPYSGKLGLCTVTRDAERQVRASLFPTKGGGR